MVVVVAVGFCTFDSRSAGTIAASWCGWSGASVCPLCVVRGIGECVAR